LAQAFLAQANSARAVNKQACGVQPPSQVVVLDIA